MGRHDPSGGRTSVAEVPLERINSIALYDKRSLKALIHQYVQIGQLCEACGVGIRVCEVDRVVVISFSEAPCPRHERERVSPECPVG